MGRNVIRGNIIPENIIPMNIVISYFETNTLMAHYQKKKNTLMAILFVVLKIRFLFLFFAVFLLACYAVIRIH